MIPVCSDHTKSEQSKKGPKEYLQGSVHHVSAETIRGDSPVILGMLLVNSIPASVLIDPRATHSFISTQFAAKHEILKLPMRKRMVVKSSGKEQISSYICPRVSMRIGEATFPKDLIVMESTGNRHHSWSKLVSSKQTCDAAYQKSGKVPDLVRRAN